MCNKDLDLEKCRVQTRRLKNIAHAKRGQKWRKINIFVHSHFAHHWVVFRVPMVDNHWRRAQWGKTWKKVHLIECSWVNKPFLNIIWTLSYNSHKKIIIRICAIYRIISLTELQNKHGLGHFQYHELINKKVKLNTYLEIGCLHSKVIDNQLQILVKNQFLTCCSYQAKFRVFVLNLKVFPSKYS